jgi:hypothetical protein
VPEGIVCGIGNIAYWFKERRAAKNSGDTKEEVKPA